MCKELSDTRQLDMADESGEWGKLAVTETNEIRRIYELTMKERKKSTELRDCMDFN